MLENNNPNTLEVQEEKDAVTVYLEKESKKKIKLIVFFSIVAVAIIAVILSFMLGKKEKDLKITSIKWDSSMKQVKSKCHAKLENEDDENLTYTYESFEGFEGPFTVLYDFDNDKLTDVSIYANSILCEDLIEKFNMKNVSYDGSLYYSEYEGYHLYLDDAFFFRIAKDAKFHVTTVTYPTEEELKSLDHAIMEANLVSMITPSTISEPEVFIENFDRYINAICELQKIIDKYPGNTDAIFACNKLMDMFKIWGDKGMEMVDMVDSAEKSAYIDWFRGNLDKLKAAMGY